MSTIARYEVRVPGEVALVLTGKESEAHIAARKYNLKLKEKDKSLRALVFIRTTEGFVEGPVEEERKKG